MIALDDEEGKVIPSCEYVLDSGIVSAILLELGLLGRVAFKNGKIGLVNAKPTGNPVIDMVLEKVQNNSVVLELLQVLCDYFKSSLRSELDKLLVKRGILRMEKTKLLWIPVSQRMDNENYAYEKEIRKIVQDIVFKNAKPQVPYFILLVLVSTCRIFDEIFSQPEDLLDAEAKVRSVLQSGDLEAEMLAVLNSLPAHFAGL